MHKAALLLIAITFAGSLSGLTGVFYYFVRIAFGGDPEVATGFGQGAAVLSFGTMMYDFPWKRWWEGP